MVLERGFKMPKNNTSPYNPSWIDRLTNWIARLPGPGWGYYAGLGVILLFIQTSAPWFEGIIPVGTFLPIHIFLAAAIAFIAGIIPYFDDRARAALKMIKPALTIHDAEYQKLTYQLTHLPALKTILASILTLIFVFVTEWIGGGAYYIEDLVNYPLSAGISRGIYLVCWWFFGAFIYHTIHQLGLINRIYTQHTHIDLFQMRPLYGFSNLTALTASSLVLLPYGFLYINPEVELTNPVVLSNYLIISTIALATFLLPQLGIHRLQQDEKEHLVKEVNKRYKATMGELLKCVDGGEYESTADLIATMNALTNERKNINGISTWPWQPETFRWLFTAMVLPLLLWLAQYFLGRILTP
jgi:hypothetical protein